MSFVVHRVVGSRTVLRSHEGRTLRIGRGTDADLRFEEGSVDLGHAEIHRLRTVGESGRYELVDLGSVTGTYVNGERVLSAALSDGDEVGIGGWLLTIRWSDPEDPLFLHVRRAEAAPQTGAALLDAVPVDYAARYRLRRGLLNKAFLALGGGVLAVLAVGALSAGRVLEPFRPGELAPPHAGRIGADACGACHAPLRGASDVRCLECHGPGRSDPVGVHVAADTLAPSAAGAGRCTACHLEHQGMEGLVVVGPERCLACHRNLRLAEGVSTEAPQRLTAFGVDHPDIRASAERPAGPTALSFPHAKHLEPGLVAPEGRVTLACGDCHRPAEADGAEGARETSPTGLRPTRFDTVCARCHALTFDDRYPELTAPHGPPEEVRGFLYSVYQDREMERSSVPDRRFETFVRPGGRNFDPALRQEAIRAEARLYQRCVRCHRIDLEATPYPEVEAPGIPERWFPRARFDHGDHRIDGLECGHCHAGAERSAAASDLLLPGIGSCTPCHGGGETSRMAAATPPFPVVSATAGCPACHAYHVDGGGAGLRSDASNGGAP